MTVSYVRSKLFSFACHAGEGHLAPVVARLLELSLCPVCLWKARLLSQDEVDDVQDGFLGDVNVSGIIAVVDSLEGMDADHGKSLQTMTDVLSMAAVANRRFKKSATWPVVAVDGLLAKVGVPMASTEVSGEVDPLPPG